jgi:hypothetical protein
MERTQASAALLIDGTVLITGGQNASRQDLDTAEDYDPLTNSFGQVSARMLTTRSGHVGVVLPNNGRVLIAGGTSNGQVSAATEVYDPIVHAFSTVGALGAARRLFGTNFFPLPLSGVMLATGGLDSAGTPLASSEAFHFPSIRSDRNDYPPDTQVTLTGTGWQPNETVSINIHEDDGDPDTNLTVTVDESGAFTNTDFRTCRDAGVTFLATGSGQTSNWTAQTKFTDSGGALNYSPKTITLRATTGGPAVSFTQTVTAPSNNGSLTASVIVAGTGTNPIPSSWVSTNPLR